VFGYEIGWDEILHMRRVSCMELSNDPNSQSENIYKYIKQVSA
jgi:hypothetical protein